VRGYKIGKDQWGFGIPAATDAALHCPESDRCEYPSFVFLFGLVLDFGGQQQSDRDQGGDTLAGTILSLSLFWFH